MPFVNDFCLFSKEFHPFSQKVCLFFTRFLLFVKKFIFVPAKSLPFYQTRRITPSCSSRKKFARCSPRNPQTHCRVRPLLFLPQAIRWQTLLRSSPPILRTGKRKTRRAVQNSPNRFAKENAARIYGAYRKNRAFLPPLQNYPKSRPLRLPLPRVAT